MGQMDTGLVAGSIGGVEREGLALGQHDRAFGKLADAQLGALEIDKNADRVTHDALHGANFGHGIAHHVMAGMAHIDAENVGPGADEFLDDLWVVGGRPERGEDLYAARSFH